MDSVFQRLTNNLRTRSDEQRIKAAAELQRYISGEIQNQSGFIDKLNHAIVDLTNSSDLSEKKAGILAIVALIEVDNKSASQPNRYAQSLRSINLNCSDVTVIRLSTWAIGRLARAEGNLVAQFIESEIDKAFELFEEKNAKGDSRKLAAILTIREMSINAPTFFFQHMKHFFELIFPLLQEREKKIRFAAVAALRASLVIVAQREGHGRRAQPDDSVCYYKKSLEVVMCIMNNRDAKEDEVHGALMIIIELLRCSMSELQLEEYETNCRGGAEEISISSIIGLSDLDQENKYLVPDYNTKTKYSYRGEEGHCNSQECFNLIKESYHEICTMVLQCKDKNRTPAVQFLLTELLPRLAVFNPKHFRKHFIEDTLQYLTTLARTSKTNSSTVFLAIGQIAFSIKEGAVSYMDNIFTVVKPYIPASKDAHRSRRNPTPPDIERNVLQLISLLSKATGEKFQSPISVYIDGMLTMSMSSALTQCLATIHANVPGLRNQIQDGLLNIFSLLIMGVPYNKTGYTMPTPSIDMTSEINVKQSKLLAIKTIGEFDFQDCNLMLFVKHLADAYLGDDDGEIRKEAARTCARKLVPALKSHVPKHWGIAHHSSNSVMAEVLSKLLTTVVADRDVSIRLSILKELNDKEFHKPLAQSKNLQSLFLAVNDEDTRVREVVVELLGNLSDENPGYILPFLRQQLSQILLQLEHSGIGRNKEQAAKLLHILIKSAHPSLVAMYMKPIMTILLPKVTSRECSSSLLRFILACIGQLAQVDGKKMSSYLERLFPFLITKLGDVKDREHTLRAMHYLVRHTGFVIEPYTRYPTLLDTLMNILKTEQSLNVRHEALRLLGQLGALNPYRNSKVDVNQVSNFPISQPIPEPVVFNENLTSQILVQHNSGRLDQYYPLVVIHALMNILNNPALAEHHSLVIQTVITVFQWLGPGTHNVPGTVSYLPKVMPAFMATIRNDPKQLDSYFNKLADLAKIVGVHIKPYVPDILSLIQEFTDNGQINDHCQQNTIMMVVDKLIGALGGEFKTYFADLIPLLTKVLHNDHSKNKEATKRVLHIMQHFSSSLDNYIHLLLPPIVATIDNVDNEREVRMSAVEAITHIAQYVDYSEHSSLMLHTLARSLNCGTDTEFKICVMQAVLAIARQLGQRFTIFTHLIDREVAKQCIIVPEYDSFIEQLRSSTHVRSVEPPLAGPMHLENEYIPEYTKLPVKVDELEKVWTLKQRFAKDDWMQWLRRLNVDFLRETPNPALRACCTLVQDYHKLSQELFNATFVSLWTELTEVQQDNLAANLRKALQEQNNPEITMTILNLAEFMEHCDKGSLPLENEVLAQCASQCNAYAKALHYVEKDFRAGDLQGRADCLPKLLSINNTLQQPQAALGVLEYAKNSVGYFEHQEDWYEELQQWDEALNRYDEKMKSEPAATTHVLGRMRCLEALGRWTELDQTVSSYWDSCDRGALDVEMESDGSKMKVEMAPIAAAAAWGLSKWSDLDKYTDHMKLGYTKSFYNAASAIHRQEYTTAYRFIKESRATLDQELTVIVKEGYHRFYKKMINLQMLSEMEEVISYKNPQEMNWKEHNRVELLDRLKKVWWKRLQGCQPKVDEWSKILNVHRLILSPSDDKKSWLKFSSICRNNGRLDLANKILVELIGEDPADNEDNFVNSNSSHTVYAYLKYLWNVSDNQGNLTDLHCGKQNAFSQLHDYIANNSEQLLEEKETRLLAKCNIKCGTWKYELGRMQEQGNPNVARSVLSYFERAKEHDSTWYKAWHCWAMMNFKAVNAQTEKIKMLEDSIAMMEKDEETESPPDSMSEAQAIAALDMETTRRLEYVRSSINGFIRSVTLSVETNPLQDILRLLTLWFSHGEHREIFSDLNEGIRSVPIDTWLQVTPQLIARIDIQGDNVRSLIHQVINDVGREHPQALTYPLSVASKSEDTMRRKVAQDLLCLMKGHSPVLAKQGLMVSDELIRIAILWHEQWHAGLEKASNYHFTDKDFNSMFAVLEPLHKLINSGAETQKEQSFVQTFGRELDEAFSHCMHYKKHSNDRYLQEAWERYYICYRRLATQISQLQSIELQYCSPNLQNAKDLELAVPGTYEPGKPLITIKSFNSKLPIFSSKQKPRKLTMTGSNGKDYLFLLKGNEDLRQDERVMQLFGLINTLLSKSPTTSERQLSIQRYSVIPLSTNSGLIGFVPRSDTLHALIKDHRERSRPKIVGNLEHRLIQRIASDYDKLPLMMKTEVFEEAMTNTQGEDLAQILWQKSPSSEVWFSRRTNYMLSHAVMCVAGYILGLGDRHPSNLMLNQVNGNIIHVDFGECFDVAVEREKFPEKVPFRLTRMMIRAMEVTGIHGTYKITCNNVMKVLRTNQDSLVAVLETFVHDPLINWRLARDTHTDDLALEEKVVNKKALEILHKIKNKLRGHNANLDKILNVEEQVDMLIEQATSTENLCQLYVGWCPFW